MRSKINKLARGIFNSTVPEIVLSERRIEKSLNADRQYNSCFSITAVNNVDVRGVVCSDNYRVVIKNNTFIGKQMVIGYEVNTRGLVLRDKIQGNISVICNAGELLLPFEFEIEEESITTSMGEVTNLFHFTNLVQHSYDEALTLFCSVDFCDVILRDNPQYQSLYECLMESYMPKLALEEFLVCVNKKNRILFSLADTKKEYDNPGENYADKLVLQRENWGYAELSFAAYGDFIRLIKSDVTTEEFAGGVYEISYLLDYEKLHAGKNYGRIIVMTPGGELACDIVVSNPVMDKDDAGDHLEIKKGIRELADLYFNFRMRRISTDVWTKQSLRVLEHIRGIDDSDDFLKLYQAQVHIAQKKPEDAAWFINYVADHLLEEDKRQEFLYSYYLYVRTLYTKDMGVAYDAVRQIKNFYEKSNNDERIMWLLLYLDEEYSTNKSLRLARIKEQYMKGSRSPFFYFEACAVFNEQPPLLRVLDSFEIQALLWGCKNNMLSEKVALRVAELVNSEKKFNNLIYRIMAHFCEEYDKKIVLEMLCNYLVRTTEADARYYKWYAAAIDAELKITGLYEKYVIVRDKADESVLPQMVALYFAYNNALPTDRKAYLYANILRNEKEHPGITKNYMSQIKRFAEEQASAGNISCDLAYIYSSVIRKGDITEKLAATYSDILLMYHLVCKDEWLCKKACTVIVKHNEFVTEERYELVNGEAYFPVYTEDVTIVFEDTLGRRFCAEGMYECSKLIKDDSLIKQCFELNNEDLKLCVHICETEGLYRFGTEPGVELYKRTVNRPELKKHYKNRMYRKMIDYFSDNYDSENLDAYLKKIDVENLETKERTRVTELLLIRGLYGEAYELMKSNGYDNISPNRLMRFCSMYLRDKELVEEEPFFTGMCAHAFHFSKYDERTLLYLLKYYNSTTKNLFKLWGAAKEFIIDLGGLEERLLVQMLFTNVYMTHAIDVFESYYARGNTSLSVIQAYLNTQSYLYFVENTLIPEKVFGYLEHELKIDHDLQDVAKMALLKYYSELQDLNKMRTDTATGLITELGKAGYVFAFYQKFAGRLPLPEELNDKVILEYRTEPGKYVELNYLFGTEDDEQVSYRTEVMEECYEGVFVRPFVMFYGEEVKYYITEGRGENANLTESGNKDMAVWKTDGEIGRYEMLNDICTAAQLNDEQTLNETMKAFEKKVKLAEKWFEPLA